VPDREVYTEKKKYAEIVAREVGQFQLKFGATALELLRGG